jgi:hypothetical protein
MKMTASLAVSEGALLAYVQVYHQYFLGPLWNVLQDGLVPFGRPGVVVVSATRKDRRAAPFLKVKRAGSRPEGIKLFQTNLYSVVYGRGRGNWPKR